MARGKSARGRWNDRRAKSKDTPIVHDGWTRAQCRAMELALGGGFAALAALEAVFGW